MIPDARRLAQGLSKIPGVVEHGLFIGLARRAILAGSEGFVSSSGPKFQFCKGDRDEPFDHRPCVRVGALIMTLGMLATEAGAQQAAAPKGPPPSAAQVQLAREIIDASGAARADGILPTIMQQATVHSCSKIPICRSRLSNRSTRSRRLRKAPAEIVALMAQAYAGHFTEAELKELITFYRSPTGKKLVTELPAVLEESFARAREWGAKVSEEFITALRAEMKKRGHNI